MISSKTFKQYLDFAYLAYQENNIVGQTFRQDGKVPYLTHPFGSALLLVADTEVPYEERERGFKILVLHDVLEKTSLSLPEWIEDGVKEGVEEVTYRGKNVLEEKLKWARSKKDPFLRLLILYDAFWSLYERHIGGSNERRKLWKNGVVELADDIEKHYGNVRIVQLARTVAENT